VSRLVLADDRLGRLIHDETRALWGGGLSSEDHHGVWRDIRATPWGERHARLHAWIDEAGELLSSLKVYRPRVRLLDRSARCPVLAAIYTSNSRRCQGHASRMVRAVLDEERRAGSPLCLLFSDIGPAFYRAFGFRALPATEQWGPLRMAEEPPHQRFVLRELEATDLESIHAAHAAAIRDEPLAVERDPSHWSFLLARTSSFFRRLGSDDVRASFLVSHRDDRFAGYLISVEGRGEWSVREVGAVGGETGIMIDLLRAGAARARSKGLGRFYGWLPPRLISRLEDWEVRSRPRTRAVPMVLALDPALREEVARCSEQAYLPYQDQF